jgi:hypothetical protein
MKTVALTALLFAPTFAPIVSAACTVFKADGRVEACEHLETARRVDTPEAIRERCNVGGLVAHKAYLEGTYDAQRPNYDTLDYLVDYWADMLAIDSNRDMARRAVRYVADRMRETGMRQPDAGAVYQFTREFMVRECGVD